MKITPRTRKLNESIREALASILLEEVRDPRVDFATVTGARISPDMRYADIYVITHGDQARYAELLAGLESAKGRIRNELGKRVALRFLPALRFHIDESVDEGMRISVALREEAERRPIASDETDE